MARITRALFITEAHAGTTVGRVRRRYYEEGRAMTMKHGFVPHGSMVVGLLFAVVILSGASRPPAEDRVPEAHSEKAKAVHAPFGDTRTAAAGVVTEHRK